MTVAVITGGVGGVGLACARRFAPTHDLMLADAPSGDLDAATTALAEDGLSATVVACDVTDRSSVARLSEEARSRGPLGVLIHAAGVSPALAEASCILEINLLGTVAVLDAFLPLASDGAVAICIASIAGQRGGLADHDATLADPRQPDFLGTLAHEVEIGERPALAYALSKRGVILLVERDARAWGERGARLVSISPGHIVDTPMGRLEAENGAAPLAASSALGRSALADEIAGACVLLASADAAHITGCDLRVDGGVVAGLRWHAPAKTQAHWNNPRG